MVSYGKLKDAYMKRNASRMEECDCPQIGGVCHHSPVFSESFAAAWDEKIALSDHIRELNRSTRTNGTKPPSREVLQSFAVATRVMKEERSKYKEELRTYEAWCTRLARLASQHNDDAFLAVLCEDPASGLNV